MGSIPGGRLGEVGIDESPDLPSLFAKLLLSGTRRVFRRGLDRGYETFTHELIGPRGRLRLDRIIKEATQLRGTAICDFDESDSRRSAQSDPKGNSVKPRGLRGC